MAFNLSEMISGALLKMGTLRVSVTTSSGSSISAIDNSLVGQTSDDDYTRAPWFCLTPSATGILAGEMAEVSSYSAGTGTFAFASGAFSSSVESKTTYGVGTPEFRLQFLIEKANEALRGLGDLDNVDVNTVTTSGSQTEYGTPPLSHRSAPIRVDVQTVTGSSATDNGWVTIHDWSYQPTNSASSGLIILNYLPPAARKLRYWYRAAHSRITAYNAGIDERVHPELAILAMVEKLYEFRNSLNRGSLPFDIQRWNDAKVQLQEARARYPIWQQARKPKLIVLGDEIIPRMTVKIGP